MRAHKYLASLAAGNQNSLSDLDNIQKQAGILNSFYRPDHWLFGDPKEEKQWEEQRNQQQLKALAATGGVAAALPFLVKAVRSRATSEENRKRTETLERAAAQKSPVIDIDSPSLDDPKLEMMQEEKEKDNEQNKTADEDGVFPGLWDTITAPVKGVSEATGLGQEGRSWTYPALAVMALAAGGGLGWKWADKQSDQQRKEKLDQKLQQAKERLDEVQFKALAEQRGIPYETGTGQQQEEEVEKTAQDQNLIETAVTAAPQLVPLYALALGYGGFKAGQYLADESSPRTQAYKELKDSLDRQVKNPDQPSELYLSSDSDMRKLFGPTTEKERKRRQEELPATGLTIG